MNTNIRKKHQKRSKCKTHPNSNKWTHLCEGEGAQGWGVVILRVYVPVCVLGPVTAKIL